MLVTAVMLFLMPKCLESDEHNKGPGTVQHDTEDLLGIRSSWKCSKPLLKSQPRYVYIGEKVSQA